MGSRSHVSLSYTDNPRQKDDSWGGWTADQTNVQTAVAAVNALVASQAALIISPSSGVSVWTSFLTHLFGYDARQGSRVTAPRVSGGVDSHGNTMPQYLLLPMLDAAAAAPSCRLLQSPC